MKAQTFCTETKTACSLQVHISKSHNKDDLKKKHLRNELRFEARVGACDSTRRRTKRGGRRNSLGVKTALRISNEYFSIFFF